MTPEKVLEVIETYRNFFISRGTSKIEYKHNELLDPDILGLEHCYSMLDSMIEFVRDGRMEKAFRWLGFIQGVLWTNGIYSLDELRNHNRPQD